MKPSFVKIRTIPIPVTVHKGDDWSTKFSYAGENWIGASKRYHRTAFRLFFFVVGILRSHDAKFRPHDKSVDYFLYAVDDGTQIGRGQRTEAMP
jgi:hypothetical protein